MICIKNSPKDIKLCIKGLISESEFFVSVPKADDHIETGGFNIVNKALGDNHSLEQILLMNAFMVKDLARERPTE